MSCIQQVLVDIYKKFRKGNNKILMMLAISTTIKSVKSAIKYGFPCLSLVFNANRLSYILKLTKLVTGNIKGQKIINR